MALGEGREALQADGVGHLGDVAVAALQELRRPLQAVGPDEGEGRQVGQRLDLPLQMGEAHAKLPGEARDREVRIIEVLLDDLAGGAWDRLSGHPEGDLALPRAAEVMAALNRLRGTRVG